VKNVSYKGTSAAVTDLAGGQLDMVIGSTTAFKPLIEAGKVKLIGNFDTEVSPLDPSVPLVSASLPGIENFDIWYGVTVANDTPADIVAKLNATLNEVVHDPAMADTLAAVGVTPVGGTPEEFTADIDADFAQRGTILGEPGLKGGS
jgi:tripartite-type tricarboxylate transporter receptor subunit TctC